MRRGKNTGASQQTLLIIIKSWVTKPCSGLQNHVLSETLIWVQDHVAPSVVDFYNEQYSTHVIM